MGCSLRGSNHYDSMTVIAALITANLTAHATDSFIVSIRADGTREILEEQQTKLVKVEAWRGAMAYWGLARYGNDFKTVDWLRGRARQAGNYLSAQAFADSVANELSDLFARFQVVRDTDKGLGIHFSAYERINDYWIPELFLISNWTDSSYSGVQDRFKAARETYGTVQGINERPADHGDKARRMDVHQALQSGIMFGFNNGDPVLFNPIARAIFATFQELSRRGQLRGADYQTHLSLVRRPVEVVSKLLTDLANANGRLIGGKPHDLAVSHNGEYTSTTGD
jgi:hypothetical protein